MSDYKNGDARTLNGVVEKYYKGKWYPQKKRSGAKEIHGTNKNGDYFGISAWNYSKSRGLLKVSAFENSKSTRFQNEQGEESIMLFYEIFYQKTGNSVKEIAQYKFSSGKTFLKKLGMVISTKAPNGGYFGKMSSK